MQKTEMSVFNFEYIFDCAAKLIYALYVKMMVELNELKQNKLNNRTI